MRPWWVSNYGSDLPMSIWWAVVRDGKIWYNSSTAFAAVARLYSKQLAYWNEQNNFFNGLHPQQFKFPNYKWDPELLNMMKKLLEGFGFVKPGVFSGTDRSTVISSVLAGGTNRNLDATEELAEFLFDPTGVSHTFADPPMIPPEVMKMLLWFAFYAPSNFDQGSDARYVRMDQIVLPAQGWYPLMFSPVVKPPKGQMLATYTWGENDSVPTKPNETGMGSESFLRFFPDARDYMATGASPPIPMPVQFVKPAPSVDKSVLIMGTVAAMLGAAVYLTARHP